MSIKYKDFFGLKIWVGITLNEKSYLKEMKRYKVISPSNFLLDTSSATTHFLDPKVENMSDRHICLICIKNNLTRFAAYGLLVHEATHVLQKIKKIMREDQIGEEMEAYAMQGISSFLWDNYDELKKNGDY